MKARADVARYGIWYYLPLIQQYFDTSASSKKDFFEL